MRDLLHHRALDGGGERLQLVPVYPPLVHARERRALLFGVEAGNADDDKGDTGRQEGRRPLHPARIYSLAANHTLQPSRAASGVAAAASGIAAAAATASRRPKYRWYVNKSLPEYRRHVLQA